MSPAQHAGMQQRCGRMKAGYPEQPRPSFPHADSGRSDRACPGACFFGWACAACALIFEEAKPLYAEAGHPFPL